MALNQAWHRTHVMPKKATLKQRVAWHVAHQQQCGCRPIPAGVRATLKKASKAG